MRPLSVHAVAAFWNELEKVARVKLDVPGAPGMLNPVKAVSASGAEPLMRMPRAPSLRGPTTVSANSGVTNLNRVRSPMVPRYLVSQ